jgi:glutamate synthase domain-containing protein 1
MRLISDVISELTDMIIQRDWDNIPCDDLRKLRKEYQERLNRGETHDVPF